MTNENKYRYLLKTSFKTDGFSVQCHVLDLKLPKKNVRIAKGDVMELAKLNPKSKKETPTALPDDYCFTKIIGVDFGQTYAGGFVCKDFKSYSVDGSSTSKSTIGYEIDGIIRNLKIKSSALSEPTRLYQNFLKQAKKKETVSCQDSIVN